MLFFFFFFFFAIHNFLIMSFQLSALYNTVPPERPYQAARSNVYFMFTLMIAFVIVSIPIGYVLVK